MSYTHPLTCTLCYITGTCHLDELKVPPVEVKVQELVVELEHTELRELIDHDSDLEWPVDVDLDLSQLNLVCGSDLLEGLKPGRTETLVNLLLVTGVDGVGVALHGFDELAVGAVTQQLENLGKKSLVLVSVTLAPIVFHFVELQYCSRALQNYTRVTRV